MLYVLCFHVLELICKCVLDVGDTCWRLWGTRVMRCANVEWCVQWLPVALCCLWGGFFFCCFFENMSDEGSSQIKFIWIVDIVDAACPFVESKTSNSIHVSRDLGLCWSRSPFEPWLKSVLKDEDGSSNTFSVWPSQTWHGVVPVSFCCFWWLKSDFSITIHFCG